MAIPYNRASFKEHILRELGNGIIQINVTDDQLDDRVDDAIQYFINYCSYGTLRQWASHEITVDDIANEYLEMNDDVLNVIQVLPIQSELSGNMWSLDYQIRLNQFWDFTSGQIGVSLYDQTKRHLNMVSQVFNGQQRLRFNRYNGKLYIDGDWSDLFVAGDYLVAEVYVAMDTSATASDGDSASMWNIWNDIFFKKYATALVKRQWGNNLKKFGNMQLPGGVEFNGQQIFDEANEEIEKLEEDVLEKYSLPSDFIVG